MNIFEKIIEKIFIKGTAKSVIGLGITTTIGYGTLYYSISIMSEEISSYFTWSKSFIFGILSLGILLGGLIAPIVGKILDKHGARWIMSFGSLFCALGLVLLAYVQTKFQFIFAILFLEMVSVLVLYEAAFVAFSQLAGVKARLPIVQITLMAGFASTIFWPLITYLLTVFTWREVYQLLALFHIFIALPIHFFVLKPNILLDNSLFEDKNFTDCICLEGKQKKNSLIVLAIAFSLLAIPITAMQTQFLAIFKGFGMEAATAVALGALIGPSQVVARVTELSFAKKITPLFTAISSTFLMFLGLIALILSGYNYLVALLFVLLYGAGQGLSDIVRGTLPLYLFGNDGYGKTIGKLNLFRLIVTSMVPFGFAFVLENFGVKIATIGLISVTLIAVLLLLSIKNSVKGVKIEA